MGAKQPISWSLMCDLCGRTGQLYVVKQFDGVVDYKLKPDDHYICCHLCREKVLNNWEVYA